MADINIMFWNIQNVYEYKTVHPEELELEAEIAGDDELNAEKIMRKSQRLYDKLGVDQRSDVANIILNFDLDLVAIVEFSVGKTDLVAQGSVDTDEHLGSVVYADHFGPEQYLITLNDRMYAADESRPWEFVKSAVNAPNIGIRQDDDGSVSKIVHKNSMFEFYAMLWRGDRLQSLKSNKDPLGDGEYARMQPVGIHMNGGFVFFDERQPYYSIFADASDATNHFTIITNHSVYGGNSRSAMDKRANTISRIASSKTVNDAVVDGHPIAVCGDFNLDYGSYEGAYAPLNGDGSGASSSSSVEQGLTTCIGDVKSTRVYKSIKDLKNAYDQIFTGGFVDNCKDAGIFNFAEHLYIDEDTEQPIYDLARRVSDHLPAIVTVALPDETSSTMNVEA